VARLLHPASLCSKPAVRIPKPVEQNLNERLSRTSILALTLSVSYCL